mgnify:CR=1 FL=1
MEDLQMYNFKVKSKVNDSYSVTFIDNLQIQITKEVENENNIFIIDKKVQLFFSKEIQLIIEKSRVLL